jgi:hypothetical protein
MSLVKRPPPSGERAELLVHRRAGLRTMAPGETYRLDVPGWFGA